MSKFIPSYLGEYTPEITLSGDDGADLNVGSGGRLGTAAFTASNKYEPAINSGTTGQFWRGDKTFQSIPGIPIVSDVTYDATTWNANLDAPTKNVVRDKFETLGTLSTQSGTFSGTSSGTNTGDQTITLTGAVTGSGTGSFATTIATPGTLTVSSTNGTATAHTHAITSNSAPGAAASLLATDAGGIIGSTGTRIVKGWFTDLTVTNSIAGSVTGSAATVSAAAQPNITSLGALGSLVVTGSITAGSDGSLTKVAIASGDITNSYGRLIISTPSTPSSAAAFGTKGTIAWDASYIYVCTAASTWRRVAIAAW